MDSESKLVKLGYSSSKRGQVLRNWIIKNNFPKGFQVLCHNCNYAKGIEKNKFLQKLGVNGKVKWTVFLKFLSGT